MAVVKNSVEKVEMSVHTLSERLRLGAPDLVH